jgi:hypothetical protein|uniref:Uncharacterized protein n=1 Tax=viral metagenome TaxID=1070528 RepID=A0A6C0LIF6_9ZZZZ
MYVKLKYECILIENMSILSTTLCDSLNSKIPMDICHQISNYIELEIYHLPDDICTLIIKFIPYHQKYIYNKTYYYQFHKFVHFTPYDGYIRNIIRNDLFFVFNHTLHTNVTKWNKKKQFMYRKVKCDSYVSLLNRWCIEYKSNKCRDSIKTILSS